MGGPGSGRRAATRVAGRYAEDITNLSRVELEPWLAKAARLGDTATVDAIVTELGGRVWQGINPYAPRAGVTP
jgi:hypothetical protein